MTGAAGFIGSNLCERLLKQGHEVTGVDNFISSNPKNMQRFREAPGFRFIQENIAHPRFVEVSNNYDQIYNLACPASPVHYQNHPLETIEACLVGTKNVLEIALKTGAKVLHASTSEIYGNPLEHPQTEGYFGNVNTLGPRSCYDEGKRISETLCYEYQKLGVDVRLVRIFNTYGPWMALNDGRVISEFVVRCLKNEPIQIYGDGSQTRSFCYIDDLIDGFLKFTSLKDSYFGPINLGNPVEFTILQIAEGIKYALESKSEIQFLDGRPDEPMQRRPDIQRAKQRLSWEPKIPFAEGLVKTMQYFKNELEGAECPKQSPLNAPEQVLYH